MVLEGTEEDAGVLFAGWVFSSFCIEAEDLPESHPISIPPHKIPENRKILNTLYKYFIIYSLFNILSLSRKYKVSYLQ